MDYAAEWDSLPAGKAPPANDYAADWDRLSVPRGTTETVVAAPAQSGYKSPITRQDLIQSVRGGPIGMGKIAIRAATGEADTLGEVGKALASGAAGAVVGGLHGLYKLAITGGDTEAASKAVEATRDALTHQPQGDVAKAIVGGISSNWNPLNWPYAAGSAIADYGAEKGTLSPAEAAAIKAGSAMVTPGMIVKGLGIGGKVSTTANEAFGSVGAAAATRGAATEATIAGASAEMQQATRAVKDVNPEALARHVQADSLPVPIKLTMGQATRDPVQISIEQNSRAKMPEYAQRFAEQSPQLHENLTAVRDQVAPDVYAVTPSENAATIIKGYQTKDAAISADISSKYKALEDANGGSFPVDGIALAMDAEARLAKKLKTDFVPAPIAKQLDRWKNGEPMNLEQYEAMRTNLASEMRKAARSGDGNTEYASGLVRDALEALPLTPEAAALKPVADAARSAAKARFDLLRADPAYQAAVNDVAPDKFMQKYVIAAPVRDVTTMVRNLGAGTVEHQAMAAGIINHLKQQAGTEANNFSQAGYNKALNGLSEKLPQIVGRDAAKTLQNVGEVAHNTVYQPRGSFVNTSNTFTAALGQHAKGLAEGAVNKLFGFGLIPIGSMIRSVGANYSANQAMTKSLQTGAGISLKDIGKK
jgi:hypothetical protein